MATGTRPFQPGLRFSKLDAVIVFGIVLILFAPALLPRAELFLASEVSWFPFAVFFLFCNVFRVRRWLELLWAAAFVALIAAHLRFGAPSGEWAFGLSVALALVIILAEMVLPSYHGVGWRWINPGLPEWWRAKHAGASEPPANHHPSPDAA